MKICHSFAVFIFLSAFFVSGCSDNKQTKTETKGSTAESGDRKDKEVSSGNNATIEAPDFADPELKKYYSVYTDYLLRVVNAIRNKDEAGTMKLFREEGKQFDNKNEMDKKAQTQEEQKFNDWLLKTFVPYNQEIIQSDYFKKYNEEYYKKVKEDFKKKGY